ncbi:MAG: Maf family protein [Eubacterium sp.]|jgi:septum formation protein|nr:Maf family protein [Eubacterium sp.]
MLILASGSPRRAEILGFLDIPFEIITPKGEEKTPEGIAPSEQCVILARQKANEIFKTLPDDIVIAADTIVVYDSQIYGKPRNVSEALNMLRALSGKTHSVFTGVCIKSAKKETRFYEESLVEFYQLSEDEMENYVKSGEPFDKAGGYGIQGKGATMIKKINGDYYNVMGLPVSCLRKLKKLIVSNIL